MVPHRRSTGPNPARSAANIVSTVGDYAAAVTTVVAVIAVFLSSPTTTLIWVLLFAVALFSSVVVISSLLEPDIRLLVASAALALIAGTVGSNIYLDNPNPPGVSFRSPPSDGSEQATCLLDIRFEGQVPARHRFVLATHQDKRFYYFEAEVQQDPEDKTWHGQVEAGFRNRGLNERYDVLVVMMNEKEAEYLSTTRQEDDSRNTYWASKALPPTAEIVASTWIVRSSKADPTCPDE